MKRYLQKKWVRVLAVVLAALTGTWAVVRRAGQV